MRRWEDEKVGRGEGEKQKAGRHGGYEAGKPQQ